MSEHDVAQLEQRVVSLTESIGDDSGEFAELRRRIYNPKLTTPAEWHFIEELVSAIERNVVEIGNLKSGLLAGTQVVLGERQTAGTTT